MQKERVYLGDWLFNAGIIGFMHIVLKGQDIDGQDIIGLGDNYIEFDRSIMAGLSQKYFQNAFDQYGRYQRLRQDLGTWAREIEPFLGKVLTKDETKAVSEIKKNVTMRTNFTLLNLKKAQAGIKITNNDPQEILSVIMKLEEILKNNYQEFFESDAKIYAGKLYGQKNFNSRQVKTGMLKMFKKSFEIPLLNDACARHKKYNCVCCGTRKAKKDVHFDTGLAPFLAANPDAINYAWNFNSLFPLCDICELIYFCSFAGFTDFSTRNENKTFYYVNRDSNVRDLYKANILFMSLFNKNMADNPIPRLISELILKSEDQKALYTLQNTSFIEVNLGPPKKKRVIMPRVFSYNIGREKANLIHSQRESLEKLAKARYKVKDDRFNIGIEIVQKILENTVGFSYADHLLRVYLLSERGNGNTMAYFNTQDIQAIVWIIYKHLTIASRTEVNKTMEKKELWNVFHRGIDLAEALRGKDAEKKISTIAYKLLNAVRIEDRSTFMETLARCYLANDMEMPSVFVKSLSLTEDFQVIGHSFINGLLGKKYDKTITGREIYEN